MAEPRRTAKGPLKKVVSDFWEDVDVFGRIIQRHMERLECGHVIRVRTDCFGEFYSARRRCSECYKELHTVPTRMISIA